MSEELDRIYPIMHEVERPAFGGEASEAYLWLSVYKSRSMLKDIDADEDRREIGEGWTKLLNWRFYLLGISALRKATAGFEFAVLAVADDHFPLPTFIALFSGLFDWAGRLVLFKDIFTIWEIWTGGKIAVPPAFNNHISSAFLTF